jgi:putative transposase
MELTYKIPATNEIANQIIEYQNYNHILNEENIVPYCSLYYHIVWSTKHRLPLIETTWEEELYGYMRGKALALECRVYAINGTTDHTHVAISIPPKLAVATLVGHLKGASSHRVNELFVPHKSFAWQSEYGAFTFSEKSLSNVVNYVNNQKKHHADKNLNRAFESF